MRPLTVDRTVTFAVRRSARRRTIGISIPREGPPVVAAPSRCSRPHARSGRARQAAVGAAEAGRARRRSPSFRRTATRPASASPTWAASTSWSWSTTGRRTAARRGGDGDRPTAATASATASPCRRRRRSLDALQRGGAGDAPATGGPLRLRDGRFELARRGAGQGRAPSRPGTGGAPPSVLNARVAHFAPLVGVAPPPVAVKDMRSRWGSCSAKGRISLHWGLVLLPLDAARLRRRPRARPPARAEPRRPSGAASRGSCPTIASAASACVRRARRASSSPPPAAARVESRGGGPRSTGPRGFGRRRVEQDVRPAGAKGGWSGERFGADSERREG